MGPKDTSSSAMEMGRLSFIGLWLMVLYVVTIAVALMAFSAFHFQTVLGLVDESGRALTIGELKREKELWESFGANINASRDNINTIEATLLRVTEDLN